MHEQHGAAGTAAVGASPLHCATLYHVGILGHCSTPQSGGTHLRRAQRAFLLVLMLLPLLLLLLLVVHEQHGAAGTAAAGASPLHCAALH